MPRITALLVAMLTTFGLAGCPRTTASMAASGRPVETTLTAIDSGAGDDVTETLTNVRKQVDVSEAVDVKQLLEAAPAPATNLPAER